MFQVTQDREKHPMLICDECAVKLDAAFELRENFRDAEQNYFRGHETNLKDAIGSQKETTSEEVSVPDKLRASRLQAGTSGVLQTKMSTATSLHESNDEPPTKKPRIEKTVTENQPVKEHVKSEVEVDDYRFEDSTVAARFIESNTEQQESEDDEEKMLQALPIHEGNQGSLLKKAQVRLKRLQPHEIALKCFPKLSTEVQRPCKCYVDGCKKSFPSKAALKAHQVKHSGKFFN